MRIIGEIPHAEMRISIFYMNQKYLLKFELGQLEQTYKFSEFDYSFDTPEAFKKSISDEFIRRVYELFRTMLQRQQEVMAPHQL